MKAVPELLLERLRLGEVSEAEQARIRQDGSAPERLQALEASDGELRTRLGPLAEGVRRKLAAAERPQRVPVLGALAAAAAVLLALAPLLPGRVGERDTRTKGADLGLVVHRKAGDGSQPLADGAHAGKGDLIQLGYRSSDKRYGAILSVDGRGSVTQHLPAEGGLAAPLEPGRSVLLGFAYELDDAPRYERFYLVAADAPFEVALARAAVVAAHAGGASEEPPRLRLPKDFEQAVFTLDKENDR